MSVIGENRFELKGLEERDYQVSLAADLVHHPDEDRIIHMDVGLGKTETALMNMAVQANENDDYSALVVTPNTRLRDQWAARIEEHGLDFDVEVNGERKENLGVLDPDNERRERLNESLGSGKDRIFRSSDVVITTYQKLSADIRNDRLEDLNIDFDEIIIDEATHLIAENDEGEFGSEKFPGGYRINRYFQDFYDSLSSARTIGLTALPGRKLPELESQIGGDVISPLRSKAEEHIQEVNSVVNELKDETMSNINHLLSVDFDVKSKNFSNAVYNEYGTEVSSGVAHRFVGDQSEEVDKAARGVLDARQKLSKASEAIVYPDLEDGVKVTPKGNYLEGLTSNLDLMDENYIVFAEQVSTVENAQELLGGNTGTVTGSNNDRKNDERIEEFKNGDLDGLVMTYGAGGEGLDLGEADRVIHMSSTAPPGRMQSATGRAKRQDGVLEHVLKYSFEPETTYEHIGYEFRGRGCRFKEEDREKVREVISEEDPEEELSWSDLR